MCKNAFLHPLTGWNTKRIAAEIGRSESWTLKYISQKYKDTVKSKSGKKGGEAKVATQRVAKEEEKKPVNQIKREEPILTTSNPDIEKSNQHENEGEAFDFEVETVTEEEKGGKRLHR